MMCAPEGGTVQRGRRGAGCSHLEASLESLALGRDEEQGLWDPLQQQGPPGHGPHGPPLWDKDRPPTVEPDNCTEKQHKLLVQEKHRSSKRALCSHGGPSWDSRAQLSAGLGAGSLCARRQIPNPETHRLLAQHSLPWGRPECDRAETCRSV